MNRSVGIRVWGGAGGDSGVDRDRGMERDSCMERNKAKIGIVIWRGISV